MGLFSKVKKAIKKPTALTPAPMGIGKKVKHSGGLGGLLNPRGIKKPQKPKLQKLRKMRQFGRPQKSGPQELPMGGGRMGSDMKMFAGGGGVIAGSTQNRRAMQGAVVAKSGVKKMMGGGMAKSGVKKLGRGGKLKK